MLLKYIKLPQEERIHEANFRQCNIAGGCGYRPLFGHSSAHIYAGCSPDREHWSGNYDSYDYHEHLQRIGIFHIPIPFVDNNAVSTGIECLKYPSDPIQWR